uniref:BTB domain-containing protein n=1 Tax=Panagrolaimus sp. JU765 TaxID=591449 RepID=A0AC34RPM8_9BILA
MDGPTPINVSCILIANLVHKTFYCTFTKDAGIGILNFGKKRDLFVNGVMNLEAEITIRISSKEMVIEEAPSHAAMLSDKRFKDFTIHVDGEEIKVHKCVLSAESPVFSAMLEPHTKEFRENKVIIDDFDHETIQAGVEFMYTHKIDDDSTVEFLLDLYKFADKYDLVDSVRLP